MAKKKHKNDIEDLATNPTLGKIIEIALDGKQREVTLSKDGDKYIVSKLSLNAPFCESFKTEKEARAVFTEKVECTNN